jgi:predicted NBD/HSP70 family sugar kinase
MQPGKPKTLKRNNRKVILDYLRAAGETTVAEISAYIELSKTTVMKIIEYYVKENIVLPLGKGLSTNEGGKKPELFRFNTTFKYAIAIHIFPTEVYIALTDLTCKILHSSSVNYRENETAQTIVSGIASTVAALVKASDIAESNIIGIAVGAHGITDFDNGEICTSPHFPSWGENLPMKAMLKEALTIEVPLFIDNQIRFQVFAEKTFGLGSDKKNIIVLEGGDGLVAGIMVKDEIKRGVHYLAGEIGHMILCPEDTAICSCGGKGCFEVLVSITRLLEKAEIGIAAHPESKLAVYKDKLTIEAVFQASEEGDSFARELLEGVLKWFTIGISNIILMYDPEIIIIQGAYSQAGEWFIERLREGVNTCSLKRIEKNVGIQYSTLGKERGILGGAAFVVSQFFSRAELYDM